MVDKFLMVVASDDDGNTDEDVTSAPVKADASEDVSIVDEMGLQSDGTGIVGDKLRISYGVTFGTPTAVSWYKDGAVIATMGSGNNGIGFELEITPTRGTGTYQATVVANGQTYTTNEIVITNKEEQGEIIAFNLEDDYTDGTDIAYDTDDNKVVATVTLKKNYAGTIAFYKANDSKYSSRINRFTTNTDSGTTYYPLQAVKYYVNTTAGGEGQGNITVNGSVLTADAPTNYNTLNIDDGSNRAMGHINADGTVTYKFWAESGTFTRGQDYVVLFDQNSILTDTAGQGNENVFDTPATVPYVTAPAEIAVTKVSLNNAPEVTFYDEDGNELTWMNGQTARALTATGFSSAQIYSAKSKTNDPKGSDVSALAGADQTNTVKKGVWTAGNVAGDVAYWFATATTKKGIFDAASATLTSDPAPLANKAASMMNLTEKGTGSVADAKTATVAFENLRADGTVFIVRGAYTGSSNTDNYTSAAKIMELYKAGKSEAIVGKADVDAGTKTVDIADAIDEWKAVSGTTGQDEFGNNYIAVFVPEDEANYGMIYTDGTVFNSNNNLENDTSKTDSCGVTISQTAAGLKNDKDARGTITGDGTSVFTITGLKLTAKDQFGNDMTAAQTATDVTSVTTIDKDAKTIEDGAAKFEVAAGGQVSIYLNVNGNTDAGDGYKISVLGQTVTVTNKSGAPIAKTVAAPGFEVKVGDDTLVAAPDSAAKGCTFTFNRITGTPASTTATLATYEGTLAAGATATLEESANGLTWKAATTDATLDLATTGVIKEDGALADYKANTYYRIHIIAAGKADAYVTMTGDKTPAAVAATYALSAACVATSGTQPAQTLDCVDQFGEACAIADLAATRMTLDENSDAGYDGVLTIKLDDGAEAASLGHAKLTFAHTNGTTAATTTATKWTYALGNGQSIVATWKAGTGNDGAADNTSTWTITIV